MLIKPRQRGFSFIEIVIGLAILGIGIAWAVPNYSMWIQNTQIRTLAESVASGLQMARVEAVRRNGQVEFVLTTSDPTIASEDIDLSTLGSDTGANWIVRAILPGGGGATDYGFVTGSVGEAGSARAIVKAGDADIAGGRNAVTFDGLGRVLAANDDGSGPIIKICVRPANPTTGIRVLEIDIGNAGQVKMCDPSVVDINDPRRCLTAGLRCS
jgi:type IV fimbrial biogenesis protein FimT